MANGGNIEYTISVNGSQAVDGFNTISKSLAHLQQAGYRLMQTGAVISAAITAPLYKAAQAGIEFDSIIEQANVNFATMLGSASKASKLVKDLTQLALKTPLDVASVQQATQTLLAFGLQSEKVIPTIKMLGDISLGNKERFDKLTLAFSQMTAAGKMMGQDLLQMINAGFNPLLIISEKTGISMGELRKTMETTGISSDIIAKAFQIATEEGGRFFNGMDNAMTTYNGQLSLLKEAVQITFGKIMTPIFDELRLKIIPSLVEWLRKLQEKFESLSPAAQKTIAIIGLIVAAIGPLLVIIGGLIFALATLSIVIGAISAPITLVIIGIAALAAAIIILWNKSEGFKTAVIKIWNSIATGIESAINYIGNLWNQYGVAIIESVILGWQTMVAFVSPILENFKQLFINLYNDIGPIWESIKTLFSSLGDLFVSLWDLSAPLFKIIGVLLWGFFKDVVTVFSGVIGAVGPAIKFIVDGLTSIVNLLTAVSKALTGDFKGAWESLKDAGKSVASAWEDVKDTVSGAINGAESGLESYIKGSENAAQKLTDNMVRIRESWENSKNGQSMTPGQYTGNPNLTFEPIVIPKVDLSKIGKEKETLASVDDAAKKAAESINNVLANAFEDIGNDGSKAMDKLTDSIKDFISAIKQQSDSILSFGDMFEKNIIERLSPSRLLRNLKVTLRSMEQWSNALDNLKEKGVGDETINSLRGMGLAGAGIAVSLDKMDNTKLNEALGYLNKTQYIAGKQAYETVKFEHSGEIWIYGVNEKGDLVDKGILDMLTQEIQTGTKKYASRPGASKTFK